MLLVENALSGKPMPSYAFFTKKILKKDTRDIHDTICEPLSLSYKANFKRRRLILSLLKTTKSALSSVRSVLDLPNKPRFSTI